MIALKDNPKGVFLKPLEEPTIVQRAEEFLDGLEKQLPAILGQLKSVLTDADAMVKSADVVAQKAQPILADINQITTNLRNRQGSLGEWLLPPELRKGMGTTLTTLNRNLDKLHQTLSNVAATTGSLRRQVEANDHILDEISSLVIETDELVRGMKRTWLLRGAFTSPSPPDSEAIDAPLLAPPGGDTP